MKTDEIVIIENESASAISSGLFGRSAAADALRFHKSLPCYAPTGMVSLPCFAQGHKLGGVYVKDEATRFGLKAFKALGGTYAMFRILCDRLGLDYKSADITTFSRPGIRSACRDIEFITATDGNHGKGVSFASSLFGCRAHVLMPAGSSELRRIAIEEAGSADAIITGFNYDQTVQLAAELAGKNGYILIQDTAWPGYEEIPAYIISGYLTLAAEAVSQLGEIKPTHIFLQAGVGAMAGGIAEYMAEVYGPDVTIASFEPETAACVYESVRVGDGLPHSLPGSPETIMAGLNCGTPCSITWPVLKDRFSFYAACSDAVAAEGMRLYAHPAGSDRAIISGESGAVTLGALNRIAGNPEMRKLLGLDEASVILLINTEGDTDPESYKRILEAI